MSDPSPAQLLQYAQGNFDRPPRPPRAPSVLQVLDLAFGLFVLTYNGIMLWSLIRRPDRKQAFTVVMGIGYTEAMISLIAIFVLLVSSTQLRPVLRPMAIRVHRWYGWVKLVLAMMFGLTVGISASEEHVGNLAIVLGLGGFMLSALHPIVILCMLRIKSLRVG